MDAGANSPARVLLEFHPARELPWHRPRLPAGAVEAAAVWLVSRDSRRHGGGRLRPAARSGRAGRQRHLLLERHGGPGAADRKHVAPAGDLPRRGRAVCGARPADGTRDGRAAAAPGLHRQRGRQPRRRRGVRDDVVARVAAGGVVCRGGRRGAAAARARWTRRAGARPRGCRDPGRPRRGVDRRGAGDGARHDLVAVLQDRRQPAGTRYRRRGEQHLSPVDGAGRSEGVLLSVAVRRIRRRLRGRAHPRRGIRHRCRGGPQTRRQASGRRRDRSGDPADWTRAPSGSALPGPARDRGQRRRPALPADDGPDVRPRGVCAGGLADAAVGLLGRAARELHVHAGVVSRGARPAQARRAARHLQLLPRALARRPAREHGGRGVRR